MPIYEYECDACGHRFELIQKFSDPPEDTCPHCSERKVHKVPSSPAIQFKGSGFYINDYARKSADSGDSKTKAASKDSTASPAAASSDSSASTSSSGSSDTAAAKPSASTSTKDS